MANTPTADLTQVTTGTARLSYAHLTQPFDRKDGTEPRYSVTVLVPKNDIATKAKIDAAIEHVAQRASTGIWGGRPPIFASPVHDGDGVRPSDGRPFGPECRGHWVFAASGKQKPSLVDLNNQDIIDPRGIYSGMYGRVNVRFFEYNRSGKKGVGCGLNHVQKVRDGEPLSGRLTVEEAFAEPPQDYVAPYAQTISITADPPPLTADVFS